MGAAWKEWDQKSAVPPPLIEGAPRLLNLRTVRYALLPTLLKISVVVSYLANVSV